MASCDRIQDPVPIMPVGDPLWRTALRGHVMPDLWPRQKHWLDVYFQQALLHVGLLANASGCSSGTKTAVKPACFAKVAHERRPVVAQKHHVSRPAIEFLFGKISRICRQEWPQPLCWRLFVIYTGGSAVKKTFARIAACFGIFRQHVVRKTHVVVGEVHQTVISKTFQRHVQGVTFVGTVDEQVTRV